MSRRHVAPLLALLLAVAGCSAPATVYVVRHGEAWTNVTPPPGMKESERDSLTPKGREQAAAAARSLADAKVETIVCSPLGRTRETAAVIHEALHTCGDAADPALAPLAEGESPEHGQERAWAAVAERASRAPLVVVTHSDVAALLIGRAQGTPAGQCLEKHKVATGSVTRIEVSR